MELTRLASIDALAREVFEEFRQHLQGGGGFAPVLFLHRFEGDDEPELIEMITLEGQEQAEWPGVIIEAVQQNEAALWALATQVVVRRRSRAHDESNEELYYVYLVADASHPESSRIWGARLEGGRRLSPLLEMTDDPRLQLMVSHLTGKHLLH